MDEKKRKQLDEQLRQLIALTIQPESEVHPAKSRPGNKVRVIRRRKGQPDMQIA